MRGHSAQRRITGDDATISVMRCWMDLDRVALREWPDAGVAEDEKSGF